MAKIAFSKLSLKNKNEIKTIKYNDQEIEVKQYLPVNDKLKMISNIINSADDTNNFSNPVKLEVFTNLEIIYNYTNISITDKQKDDFLKLYDLMEENGLFDAVIGALPSIEYKTILDGVKECAEAIYKYRNSALGIMEIIGRNYDNLNLDLEELQKNIADPANLELLKKILTKMG